MSDSDEVRVRFVTQDASIRVVDTPFAVPITLARYGLSQIVNHLLGRGKLASRFCGISVIFTLYTDPPMPFDFIINDELLRVPLKRYLEGANMSAESIVTLQYIPALQKPDQNNELDHPDWVGAVAGGVDG